MAYKSVFGSAPAPTSSSGYKSVFDGGIPNEDTPDESGGPSLFGFLGNVGQEAKDMFKGVTSLVGAGLNDLGNASLEALTLGKAETPGYKLDDIAMALPKAIAEDYNERYGLSKFASGDIFGGLSAILTGLYERPLSAIGDALMVGSAVKWTARAGLVGEATQAKILGPGVEEAATLTGATNVPQVLSQNPVARLAQRKLYEAMSYGGTGDRVAGKLGFGNPQDYITARSAAGATDEAIRATQNLARAAGAPGDTPLRVLRPTASKFIEKRGVSTILSRMGMQVGDTTAQASSALRGALEGFDEATLDEVTSLTHGTRGVLPDAAPSDQPAVHYVPATQPEGLPDFATFVDETTGMPGFRASEGTSPTMLKAAQDFGPDFRRSDPRSKYELNSPDDLGMNERNSVTLTTENMESAFDVAKRYADSVGGAVVAAQNDFANLGSYDGIAYGVRAADGTLHRVNVATKELIEAQETWSHMALQAKAKQDAIAELEAELNELAQQSAEGGGSAAQEMSLMREIAEHEDELDAIEVLNDQTFNYTRRTMNTGDGTYDPALAAADRIRNIVYNHATRLEIDRGALTYRKALDRAFGPLRAEKWSKAMRIVEEHIAVRLQKAMESGVPKDEWDNLVLDVTDRIFGENNPWAEAMFRGKLMERFNIETGDVMPRGLRGADTPLTARLSTGERVMDPRPYAARGAYGGDEAYREALEAGASEEAAMAAYDEAVWAGSSEEIAHRLTWRLREATHKAMVENGEFPTMTWKDLAREQTTAGDVLPFPQYFPHIKASKVTGDVAILNQQRTQMKTVLEGTDQRMKKWGGWLYERGMFERDPIKAYEAMFRQVQRNSEFRDALHLLIDKYGRNVSQEELSAWDLGDHGEVLVSRAGLDNMIDTRSKMITLTHEGVMDGLSLEDATVQALDQVTKTAEEAAAHMASGEVWALPKYVAQQMKTAAKLQMPGTFNFYYDSAMGVWKAAALSLSPRWIVNNSLGNSIYMGLSRPGAIRHFVTQLMPGARARFKAAFGEEMLGAIERDFMHGEDLLTSTQRMARRAERADVGWGQRVAESSLQEAKVVRGVRNASTAMRSLNRYIEGAARRGVAIDEVRRMNMTRFGQQFLSSNQIMADAASRGIMDLGEYDRIIRSVNSTLGDYLTMSPVESQIIRRFLMPFYAFYRHTAKFMARMPFEHPLKMNVLEQITEVDRQMNPYMPEYMLGTANIAGLNVAFGSANPMEAIAEAYAPQVTHPLLGLTIQRHTGTNPFGKPWTNEPPGGSVTTFGGDRYVIHRDANGNVTGVQPAGPWAPPLYESLLGMIPQAALIFDPFDRAVAKRILGPATGLTFPSYNPQEAQYYAVRNHLSALKQAMGTPPP